MAHALPKVVYLDPRWSTSRTIRRLSLAAQGLAFRLLISVSPTVATLCAECRVSRDELDALSRELAAAGLVTLRDWPRAPLPTDRLTQFVRTQP